MSLFTPVCTEREGAFDVSGEDVIGLLVFAILETSPFRAVPVPADTAVMQEKVREVPARADTSRGSEAAEGRKILTNILPPGLDDRLQAVYDSVFLLPSPSPTLLEELDSLLARAPQLRRVVLRQLLIPSGGALPIAGPSIRDEFSTRTQALSRMTPFEELSLAEKRYEEIYENPIATKRGPSQLGVLGALFLLLELIGR